MGIGRLPAVSIRVRLHPLFSALGPTKIEDGSIRVRLHVGQTERRKGCSAIRSIDEAKGRAVIDRQGPKLLDRNVFGHDDLVDDLPVFQPVAVFVSHRLEVLGGGRVAYRYGKHKYTRRTVRPVGWCRFCRCSHIRSGACRRSSSRTHSGDRARRSARVGGRPEILQKVPDVDSRLPHGALGGFVRGEGFALLDAQRSEHAHHCLVLFPHRLDTENLIDVVEETLVIANEPRITLVGRIDELLRGRVGSFGGSTSAADGRSRRHPSVSYLAARWSEMQRRYDSSARRHECNPGESARCSWVG